MKKYTVRATGMEFLPEIDIEAESEEEARDTYREKFENGELQYYDYDLEIKVEGGD